MNTILLLAVTLTAPAPKDSPAKPSRIAGEWELVSIANDGQTLPHYAQWVWVFTPDGKFRNKAAKSELWHQYRTEDATVPNKLDIVLNDQHPQKQKLVEWAYELDGESLSVGWNESNGRPPVLAAPKGSKTMIFMFKRVKPKD